MEETCSIRLGNQSDLQALVAFNRAMAKETEGIDLAPEVVAAGVAGLLERPEQGFYLVAEASGTVIGCLMVTHEWSDWRNGLFWWIQSVYVTPAHRRRGVYKKLYEYVKQSASRENVCGFRLYVDKENRTAQQAYEALGMRETDYKIFEALRRG
jgi:GNAT superfamily N-acetyltransferase